MHSRLFSKRTRNRHFWKVAAVRKRNSEAVAYSAVMGEEVIAKMRARVEQYGRSARTTNYSRSIQILRQRDRAARSRAMKGHRI
jgi:hypothetical protein